MDTETYTATVGGGCLLGDLAQFLYKYGRAMPHGTWPGVGLGGHATTGGIGPASRMWGLTLDHVIGVEVVLADSSIVDASEDKNSDLFFAIKGAAASFGIVTQFRLRTHVAPGECVRFQHTMESFDVATRSEWFKMWQRLMADPLLSRFLSVGLEVFPQKMVIGGNYFRSKKDFDDLDLLAALPSGGTYQETVAATWIDMVDGWAEGIRVNFGGGASRPFYAKTLNFKQTQLVPDGVADDLFQLLAKSYAGGALLVVSFHPAGGEVNDVRPDATAYAHRDTLYWMQFAVVNPGSLSAEGRSLVHDIDKLVGQGMPQANFGAYLGHVDPDLENSSAAYWGSNVPRLQSLKGKFDENDIFHNPQSLSFGSKVIGENYNRKPTKELLKIDTHHHFVPADLSFGMSHHEDLLEAL